MKNLEAWFQRGMTFQQYVDGMEYNRETMLSIYEQFKLSSEEQAFFAKGKEKNLRILVLTADWCGDAMLCIPIVKRIAEAASFDMRFFIRDENLELMDQYLTNGTSRSIPIFIWIDENGEERAVWGPRAPEVQKMVSQMMADLPSSDAPDFVEKQKEMFRAFRHRVSTDQEIWESVKRSVREKLEPILK
jgi:hypothetical protein